MSRPLPPNPSLKQLKAQAKDLLKAHQQDDARAVERLKASFPRLAGAPDGEIRTAPFSLRDAQLVIAREYGFTSWPKLAAALEGPRLPSCSFCDRSAYQVHKVIAGPQGVHICDECVRAGQGSHPEWETSEGQRCSFCGRSAPLVQVATRVDSEETICNECLDLCVEVLEGKRESTDMVPRSIIRPRREEPVCSVCGKDHRETKLSPALARRLRLCRDCVEAGRQALSTGPVEGWERAPEATCSVCLRNASYELELAAGPEGRACLCNECADLLQKELNTPGGLKQQEHMEYFRNILRQLAEKHQAGDPDAIQRVKEALPQWRHLSPEEIRQAPLELEEAFHVLTREAEPPGANVLSGYVHEYVEALLDLEGNGEPDQSHQRYLEVRASRLVEAHHQGLLPAARRIKAALPKRRDASLKDILKEPFTREDAQEVIAREFGLETWVELLEEDAAGPVMGGSLELLQDAEALEREAAQAAANLGHEHAGTEHLLLALIQSQREEITTTLAFLGLERPAVEQSTEKYLGARVEAGTGPALNLRKLIKTTGRIARAMRNPMVHLGHLLLALIQDPRSGAAQILAGHDLDFARARQKIAPAADQLVRPLDGIAHYTDGVKQVVQSAREESRRLGHNYTGTNHLLLGIVREGKGTAVTVLSILGVNPEALTRAIEEYVGSPGDNRTVDDAPFTPRAKLILEAAAHEARELEARFVDTEHLLLALLKDREAVSMQILAAFGVGYEQALEEVRGLL